MVITPTCAKASMWKRAAVGEEAELSLGRGERSLGDIGDNGAEFGRGGGGLRGKGVWLAGSVVVVAAAVS